MVLSIILFSLLSVLEVGEIKEKDTPKLINEYNIEADLLTFQPKIVTASKQESEQEEPIKTQQYSDDELRLLACCVEAEAGIEDLKGKRLVVDVILNRVDSCHFPNSIAEVIKQRNQFSTWTNGAIDRINKNDLVSDETLKAIEIELEGRIDYKVMFFTSGYYNPYGTREFIHQHHYFGYYPE